MATVKYHDSFLIRNLVEYIKLYSPRVTYIVRPKDEMDNFNRGYISGQPDILIIEPGHRYIGLAIWAKPMMDMTKYDLAYKRKLARQSYSIVMSDDNDKLVWAFTSHMLECHGPSIRKVKDDWSELMQCQMEGIDASIRSAKDRSISEYYEIREYNSLSALDYEVLDALVDYFEVEDPGAVVIPGLGVDGQPDLLVISPDITHNGLAIWLGYREASRGCNGLSYRQTDFLKRLICRSFAIIKTEDSRRVWNKVDHYLIDKRP